MPGMNGDDDELLSYESVVGIRHYVTRDAGSIGGQIKRIISDFIVQEITVDKDVIKTVSEEKDVSTARKPNRNTRKYTKFVLKKFGCDTIHAVEHIAKAIGVPSEKFTFAGIKDNQAITAQQVTVEGDRWQALVSIAGSFDNFKIVDIDFAAEPLTTGDLWGNKFIIRIRDIDLDKPALDATTKAIIETLEARGGFLNYFGLQRFGTHRPNSQKIGKNMVLENWEGAIEELLVPSFPRETQEAITARALYRDTRDAAAALEAFPKSLYYERLALEHLASHPSDFKGALLSLPKTILSLYAYSFQSFLFNEVVSMRVERLGDDLTRPRHGDLVSLLDVRHGQITRVRYVVDDANVDMLEKHIRIGKATITVPIIGSKLKVNENNPFLPIYDELLEREGLEKRDFIVDDPDMDYSLHGVFRPLALYPRNLRVVDVSDDDLNPGKRSVKLTFELPKGTYATMFLRELMKIDNQYL